MTRKPAEKDKKEDKQKHTHTHTKKKKEAEEERNSDTAPGACKLLALRLQVLPLQELAESASTWEDPTRAVRGRSGIQWFERVLTP